MRAQPHIRKRESVGASTREEGADDTGCAEQRQRERGDVVQRRRNEEGADGWKMRTTSDLRADEQQRLAGVETERPPAALPVESVEQSLRLRECVDSKAGCVGVAGQRRAMMRPNRLKSLRSHMASPCGFYS